MRDTVTALAGSGLFALLLAILSDSRNGEAFIQRLRGVKFNLTIETVSGVDIAFEGESALFLARGAVYRVVGEPQDVVRHVAAGIAWQVGAR